MARSERKGGDLPGKALGMAAGRRGGERMNKDRRGHGVGAALGLAAVQSSNEGCSSAKCMKVWRMRWQQYPAGLYGQPHLQT